MLEDLETRAWVEVDLDALRANFHKVRSAIGPRPGIIAMVKADAYGLGAERVVRALEPLGPWGYGVATADEGAALRRIGVERPILLCAPPSPQSLRAAAESRAILTVSDMEMLWRWRSAASPDRPLEFHVDIDTGMGRAGFDWRDAHAWGAAVKNACTDDLMWTGVMTHFQNSDGPDDAPTQLQWSRFNDAIAQLPVSREDLMVHVANSAAAVKWRDYSADAVRPGIFLYGGSVGADAPAPEPVVSVRARLVLVKDVPPGSTCGYGATHVARNWERWGTVAIGYGDGLPRKLGNRGTMLVRGQKAKVVGRISMDMTVVDITGIPEVTAGDIATIIGSDGAFEMSLDEVASHAETISYEILTGLRPRLPRVEKDSWTGSS